MEQILLYIVTISGFSGFMLGLYSLLIPGLQRRGIRLPFSGRSDEEDDLDLDDDDNDDARHFAATSFSARRSSLLDRLPSRAAREDAEDEDEPEFEEDELLGDLDLSKERAEVDAEDDDEFEDDELAELTFEAEVDPVLEELANDIDEEDEEDEDEDGEDDEDDEDDEEDEDEYEDDEEEAEPEKPVVHVVSGGGNDDMLALFEEGAGAVKEIEAWRADLADPAITELLAEAREISALLKGRRPPA